MLVDWVQGTCRSLLVHREVRELIDVMVGLP